MNESDVMEREKDPAVEARFDEALKALWKLVEELRISERDFDMASQWYGENLTTIRPSFTEHHSHVLLLAAAWAFLQRAERVCVERVPDDEISF